MGRSRSRRGRRAASCSESSSRSASPSSPRQNEQAVAEQRWDPSLSAMISLPQAHQLYRGHWSAGDISQYWATLGATSEGGTTHGTMLGRMSAPGLPRGQPLLPLGTHYPPAQEQGPGLFTPEQMGRPPHQGHRERPALAGGSLIPAQGPHAHGCSHGFTTTGFTPGTESASEIGARAPGLPSDNEDPNVLLARLMAHPAGRALVDSARQGVGQHATRAGGNQWGGAPARSAQPPHQEPNRRMIAGGKGLVGGYANPTRDGGWLQQPDGPPVEVARPELNRYENDLATSAAMKMFDEGGSLRAAMTNPPGQERAAAGRSGHPATKKGSMAGDSTRGGREVT